MALEMIETDAIGMTGSVRTRTGDKLNVLLLENSERAVIMLIQNGELEAFKYVPNQDKNGIPYRITEEWSSDDIHRLLWPKEEINEKRALIVEGLLFFVNTYLDNMAKAMADQVCDKCRDEIEHSHHQPAMPTRH